MPMDHNNTVYVSGATPKRSTGYGKPMEKKKLLNVKKMSIGGHAGCGQKKLECLLNGLKTKSFTTGREMIAVLLFMPMDQKVLKNAVMT